MPKLCQHPRFVEAAVDCDGCKLADTAGAHTRPIKTCSDCGARLGTCPHCKELQALDAEGYISYHDWPKPGRMICPGAKYSSLEDVEHAKASV